MTGSDHSTESAAAAGGAGAVRERIAAAAKRAGRPGDAVTVLAATKYVDAATVAALAAAGMHDMAENRLDALAARREALAAEPYGPSLRWHFIGRLQSRQAVDVARNADVLHTLASQSAAARLARAADEGALSSMPMLLVQVNVAGDPAKGGLAPGEVDAFLDALPGQLSVSGFMTMPAAVEVAESSRPAFAELRALLERLAPLHSGRHLLSELSMGTSQDFEVAVEEGATMVRLGRVLHGSPGRPG